MNFINENAIVQKAASFFLKNNIQVIKESIRKTIDSLKGDRDQNTLLKLENIIEKCDKQVPLLCESENPSDAARFVDNLSKAIANTIREKGPQHLTGELPSPQLLGTIYAKTTENLMDTVGSRFLASLLTSIASGVGKRIVDPERGGKPLTFASTREPMSVNWESIDRKDEYLFNLLIYFLRYTRGDLEKAKQKVAESIKFPPGKSKSGFTQAMKRAESWYTNGRRLPFDKTAETPTHDVGTQVDTEPQKPAAKETLAQTPEPAMPTRTPKMTDAEWNKVYKQYLRELIDWYFNPANKLGKNIGGEYKVKLNIKAGNSGQNGRYNKEEVEGIVFGTGVKHPTIVLNKPEDVDKALYGMDQESKMNFLGNKMTVDQVRDKLKNIGIPSDKKTRIDTPEDVEALFAGMDPDQKIPDPYGSGMVKVRDVIEKLKQSNALSSKTWQPE